MNQVVDFDLSAARRWAVAARSGLSDAQERINALNVFPVPDGDTGTNMVLTLDGALDALKAQLHLRGADIGLREGLEVIARGMLLSARGNSGVILSQLSRGLHEAVAAGGPGLDLVGPEVLVEAFERSDALAWEGVTTPVEGTILSVSRAAAEGARSALSGTVHVHDIADAAVTAATEALQRTPEQLPVLARAGVVDAGGAGYVILIEALEKVLSGRLGPVADGHSGWLEATPAEVVLSGLQGCDHEGDGAHEVMYLLTGSDAARADRLRAHLARVGNSVLVVGGPQTWRVHVHLDDPRQALEAGAVAGHLEQVTVTSLTGADPDGDAPGAPPQPAMSPSAVVACTPSTALAEMFTLVGAQSVHSAPGARASTGELLSAIWAAPGQAVVLLPNDADTVLAAQAAARASADDGGVEVHVVPSVSIVQGLSAMAVWDADSPAADNAAQMADVVRHTRHGGVTTATKDADTPVGRCRSGQALGMVDGRIARVADDPRGAAAAVLEVLVDADTEILTVVTGAQAAEGELREVLDDLQQHHPDLEVVPVQGGQGTYAYLFGAE